MPETDDPRLEDFTENEVYLQARVGPVQVTVWKQPPEPSALDEAVLPFARWAQERGGGGMMQILRVKQSLSPKAAQHAADLAKAHGQHLCALAVVEPDRSAWVELNHLALRVIFAFVASFGRAVPHFWADPGEAAQSMAAAMGESGFPVDGEALARTARWMMERASEHESPVALTPRF